MSARARCIFIFLNDITVLGPRVVGEGVGRGNGESITAKAMTSRHTNVSETN